MFTFQSKQQQAPTRSALPTRSTLPTLTINRPGDSYEREADRAAEQVMRATGPGIAPGLSTYAPGLQRACECGGTCADCQAGTHDHEHPSLQLKAADGGHGELQAPSVVNRVLSSAGQLLDPQTRAFMEPRFGSDFSRVRVHSGTEAEQSAQAVNALAYTVGPNIVFGPGQYAPTNHAGQLLLAHELAHVVQQRGTPGLLQREPHPDKKDEQKKEPKKDDAKKGKDAECTYSVNYVPKGEIDCETLFQQEKHRKPPRGKFCGRVLLFDIKSVSATGKCPPFKGTELKESIKSEADKAPCLPPGGEVNKGQGCPIASDGTLACHDVYDLCGLLSDLGNRTNGGCQQTYKQTLTIGEKEIENHTIFFDMDIDTVASTCSTTVTRDGKVIKPGNP